MGIILLLYDLQNEIKNYAVGKLPESVFLEPNPNQNALIDIAEQDDAKTIHVSNRTAKADGITVNMGAIPNLRPGDRLTISGRIGDNAPTAKWGVLIHRGGGNYCLLEQHQNPLPSELFHITYLLDEVDLHFPIRLHTDHWGNEESHMDLYVDDILITRNAKGSGVIADIRDIVYSLATDTQTRESSPPSVTISSFLRISGNPEYIIVEEGDKKSIFFRKRVHDWDGLDINVGMMSLKSGNSYTITIKGRPEGEVPPESQLMMQVLPGYVWRDNKNVYEEQEFTLEHTLSNAEILNAESIRIASTPAGGKMSFVITDICIRVNKEGVSDNEEA